jgi:predicted PurR-regulated permease PerM
MRRKECGEPHHDDSEDDEVAHDGQRQAVQVPRDVRRSSSTDDTRMSASTGPQLAATSLGYSAMQSMPSETQAQEPTPGPQGPRKRPGRAPIEGRALGTAAVLAVLVLGWIASPVGLGIVVGALFAFALNHGYRRLVRRTRSPHLMALACSALSTVGVAGTVGVLGYLLVLRGVAIVGAIPHALAEGGGASAVFERLTQPLARYGLAVPQMADKIAGLAGELAGGIAGYAAHMLSALADWILALVFMAMTTYFVLMNWTKLAARAEHMLPLNPHHTRTLLREAHRLGRQVLLGTLGTSVVQGLLAGIGYAIVGVPQAPFFGAMTAVASLLPALGTLFVWVPIDVYLFATDRTVAGIVLLAYCSLVVVVLADYVIRPRLVGHGQRLSTWVTFVALFGGLKVFGAVGFLLGPFLIGIALASLRLYERERLFRLRAS